jgi:hypothetical protein
MPGGTIFGTVYDSGTTVLSAATVSCPGLIVTNVSGSYYTTTANPGTYALTASCANYTPKTINVTILSGQTKSQDFHLVHV